MTYHSVSTSVHDSNQVEEDHGDKNQSYRYSVLVSATLTSLGETNRSPSKDQVDRSMRTLKRKKSVASAIFLNRMTTLPDAEGDHSFGTLTHNWALELGLETLKVTDVGIYQRHLTFPSEIVPESIWSRRGAVAERIGTCAPRSVVSPNLMRDRVSDFEVIGKGTGRDLIIVSWVTPSTEPAHRGVIKDRCIGKVGASIYDVGHQHVRQRYRCKAN